MPALAHTARATRVKAAAVSVARNVAIALITAALVTCALLVAAPWQSDIDAAMAVHAAEPLDVNDPIIVRWETAEGAEVLPPEVMPLWRYVWYEDTMLSARISDFEQAADYLLSDPEMQGHLIRHGVTQDEIDHLRWKLTRDDELAGGQ